MTSTLASNDGALGVVRARPGRLKLALLLLGIFSLVLGVTQLVLDVAESTQRGISVSFTLVSWVWCAAGIVAWWRRPASATGALLIIGSIALFAASLGNFSSPVFEAIGSVFGTTVLAIIVHLLHAFPSGRLHGRFSVAIVATAYFVALILQMPSYLAPPDSPLVPLSQLLQQILGLVVIGCTAALLISRLRSAEPRNLKVLLPLYLYGSLVVPFVPLSADFLPLLGVSREAIVLIQVALVAGIPVVFLLGVLFGGFESTAEAEALSAWLSAVGSTRAAVAEALRRTLGDESLRVAYWLDEREIFVDADGEPLTPPSPGSHRGWQNVYIESRLIGSIEYDDRMIGDRSAVTKAGNVLAIALDRERLTAALMASNMALMQSRARLVEAADRERNRIARDLHDGLQVQLVLLALQAQQIAISPEPAEAVSVAATGLRHGIDSAAGDLRRLVHDMLPSALVERGLTAAVEDLIDRLTIPAHLETNVDDATLPAPITQTAYLLVAEALTNAVKHARADSVSVRLKRVPGQLLIHVKDDGVGGASLNNGTGLKGLIDRVEALGGTLGMVSVTGHGTDVSVELPCA